MARDYLTEASSIIFGNKVSLPDLVATNPDEVIANLLGVLEKARNPMQSTIRKAAVYALGQIGDSRSLPQLTECYRKENAPGVIDAMQASMTAIKLMPEGSHHSETDRRQLVQYR